MASSIDAAELTLPDGFPLAPKGCEKPSRLFFECFTTAGVQKDGVGARSQRPERKKCERVTLFAPQDAAAGARGLAECAAPLAAYRKCLAWHERARPQPAAYRVPEAYRPGGDAYGVHE